MSIGTKIIAPEGWRALSKDDPVYFLDRNSSVVCLVLYVQSKCKKAWTTKLLRINAVDFEEVISTGKIAVAPNHDDLPPWFPEGKDREWAISRLHKVPKSGELATKRQSVVKEVLSEIGSELSAQDLQKRFNKLVREKGLNTTRTQSWLFTYVLFGEGRWTLQPANWDLGQYDRKANGETMFGRPPLSGKSYGKRLTSEDVVVIEGAYRKWKGLGVNLTWIHRRMLLLDYNVPQGSIVATSDGRKRIVLPDGTTTPTYDQFAYHLRKKVGSEKIFVDRFGSEKARNKRKADKGMVSELCANLMGQVERDVYVLAETAKGVSGADLGKLHVALMVDRLSSAIVGIGFSLGSETAEAYRMAEFCAAIDKNKFLQIMGMPAIEHDLWPCVGMPRTTITDRGAGAGENSGAAMSELTPSYAPRSKPMVESSNPKKDNVSGPPRYKRTSLSPLALMRNAVRRAILSNNTKNVSHRLTNEMIERKVNMTPAAIWCDLDHRMRNSASQISFEEAVRKYLEPIKVTVTSRGIKNLHQRYHSESLFETGLLDRAISGVFEIDAYYLPMNMRFIWVDTGDKLIEVPAIAPFADDEEQLFITYHEQLLLNHELAISKSEFKEHQTAVYLEIDLEAKDDNGLGLTTSHPSNSKPKPRTKASKEEMKVISGGPRGHRG